MKKMIEIVSDVLFAMGLLILEAGLYLLHPIAAIFALGLFLCYCGYATNEKNRESN